MAASRTILSLVIISLGLAALAGSATESTTTTAPKTTRETPAVDLCALLRAREGATVTLVAGQTRLVVHRVVLTARSPVFKALLSNNTPEASSGQLNMRDVEGPVLRQLVAYLYTLQAPQLSSMAPQLLAVADSYGVSGLKAACEQQLLSQLAVDNAATLAALAVRHSCPRLKEAAVAFIRANFANVVATQAWRHALVNHPEDMADVIQLLVELPAGTRFCLCRTAAATEGGSTPGPQPHAGSSQTTAASEPATAAGSTSPPGGGAVSANSAPPPADGGSAPGEARSSGSQTPAAPTPAPPACNASLPDDDTVSRYRSLSAAERGRRLLVAAKEGKAGEVRALLAAGANVRARDEKYYRFTALHYAARGGHAEAASCLLAGGAEVDARESEQQTPLDRAAYWGRTALVRLLAAASADLSARDQWGHTPLHHAAMLGHAEAAAALLEAGADRWLRNDEGKTPLDVAKNQQLRQLLCSCKQ